MEPLDERSRDLVANLLLLAVSKAGGQAKTGAQEAIRNHETAFATPNVVDLSEIWNLLQDPFQVARDAASDACAFIKAIEGRFGISVRAPLAAVTREATKPLVSDTEVDRFFTAAAIRPTVAGMRSLPGLAKHTIGGHAVNASAGRGSLSGIKTTTLTGRPPELDAEALPPPAEENTETREAAAVKKLDALYDLAEPTRPMGGGVLAAGKPRVSGSIPRQTGSAPRVTGGVPRQTAATKLAASETAQQRKKLIAGVLMLVMFGLVAFVLVPTLRSTTRATPTVVDGGTIAPLLVNRIKVLGADAEADLTDPATWLSYPPEQRSAELEQALEKLRPMKVTRLAVLADGRVVASAQVASGHTVVRFGR